MSPAWQAHLRLDGGWGGGQTPGLGGAAFPAVGVCPSWPSPKRRARARARARACARARIRSPQQTPRSRLRRAPSPKHRSTGTRSLRDPSSYPPSITTTSSLSLLHPPPVGTSRSLNSPPPSRPPSLSRARCARASTAPPLHRTAPPPPHLTTNACLGLAPRLRLARTGEWIG